MEFLKKSTTIDENDKNCDSPPGTVCNMAYIASFFMVNKDILKQRSFPSIFTYQDETGIRIFGSWLSWQLCLGGNGNKIQMQCIIDSGSVSYYGYKCDLTGTHMTIEIDLDKLESNSKERCITLVRSHFPHSLSVVMLDILGPIFENYFNDDIGSFSHIFASLQVSQEDDSNGSGLFEPVLYKYIIERPDDATLENTIFCMITTVNDNSVNHSKLLRSDVAGISSQTRDIARMLAEHNSSRRKKILVNNSFSFSGFNRFVSAIKSFGLSPG